MLVSGSVTVGIAEAQTPDAPIVVTARRLEEPVYATPVSVSAFDSDSLGRMGADTLADVARAVPNFAIAPNGVLGVGTPTIRGVFSPAGASTVALYLDDVPIQIRSTGFSRNADLRTFDLDRIEILRGPQGTLFGASAMGGTVRFITRQPDFAVFDARMSGEIGLTEGGGLSRETQAAAGGPIVPGKLGFRASVYHREDAGYVDRIDRQTGAPAAPNVDDASVFALRAGLRAAIGEGIEITPALFYQRGRRDDYPFFESTLGPWRQSNVNAQPGRDYFLLPSLTATADLGGATLTSVTAYFDRDDRQVTDYSLVFGELVLGGAVPGITPEGGTRSLTHVYQHELTQEVRIASVRDDTPMQWVFGGFYRDARLGLTQEVIEPGIAQLAAAFFGGSITDLFGTPLLPGGISYRGVEHTRSRQIAGFGEVHWRPVEQLEMTAGLRVSRSELDLSVLSEGPYAGGTLAEPANRTQRETPVTPRFGLSYRPGPDRLFYISVGRGFRVGGANTPVPPGPCADDLRDFGLTEAPVSFDSDRLWNYEAGVKATLAAQRLRLAVSAFQIDWSGIQQPVNLPNCGFSYVDNLGRARNRGFEAEIEARPMPGLRLAGALGFVDARFRGTVLGGTSDPDQGRAAIVRAGDRVPYVPRWTGRLAAEYRAPLRRARHVHGRIEYQFTSAYRRAPSKAAIGYDPRVYRGEGYSEILARLGIEGTHWRVSIFVENLLGDRSILFSSAEFVPVTGAPLRQMTLRPRTFGVAASYQF